MQLSSTDLWRKLNEKRQKGVDPPYYNVVALLLLSKIYTPTARWAQRDMAEWIEGYAGTYLKTCNTRRHNNYGGHDDTTELQPSKKQKLSNAQSKTATRDLGSHTRDPTGSPWTAISCGYLIMKFLGYLVTTTTTGASLAKCYVVSCLLVASSSITKRVETPEVLCLY